MKNRFMIFLIILFILSIGFASAEDNNDTGIAQISDDEALSISSDSQDMLFQALDDEEPVSSGFDS